MRNGNGYFEVREYKVTSERFQDGSTHVNAEVEMQVEGRRVRRAATGNGPVHALDAALRDCLMSNFPELDDVRLSDYRVSVVDAVAGTGAVGGTGAKVKILIESTDGRERWDAGCVSENIVDASFEALCSTAVMGIIRARNGRRRSA